MPWARACCACDASWQPPAGLSVHLLPRAGSLGLALWRGSPPTQPATCSRLSLSYNRGQAAKSHLDIWLPSRGELREGGMNVLTLSRPAPPRRAPPRRAAPRPRRRCGRWPRSSLTRASGCCRPLLTRCASAPTSATRRRSPTRWAGPGLGEPCSNNRAVTFYLIIIRLLKCPTRKQTSPLAGLQPLGNVAPFGGLWSWLASCRSAGAAPSSSPGSLCCPAQLALLRLRLLLRWRRRLSRTGLLLGGIRVYGLALVSCRNILVYIAI